MKKIAVVRQTHPSEWASCRSISKNLREAYLQAFVNSEVREFTSNSGMSHFETFSEARQISAFAPEAIVFLDHAPHPSAMIAALSECLGSSVTRPRLVFHFYGDLTLFAEQWLAAEAALRGFHCQFICASERQCSLLAGFLEKSANVLHWIPFPVDVQRFSFSPDERGKAKRGFMKSEGDGDYVFLYTGRLSLQKNVLPLARAFADYVEHWNPNSQLWLSGPVDDLGIPYLGKRPLDGLMSFDLASLLGGKLKSQSAQRIRIFDNCNADELVPLYRAADAYVSLSTHNDEDYGMAPAEAAACGLPLVLSDWGGFASFSKLLPPGAVSLVRVSIEKSRVLPSHADAVRALSACSLMPSFDERRKTISDGAALSVSVDAVAARIQDALLQHSPPPFLGFSRLFREVGQAFRLNPDAPFSVGTNYSELFRRVYRAYI